MSTAPKIAVVKTSTMPGVLRDSISWLESGNDALDYSSTALYIGHRKLPVELSVLWGFSFLSFGRKMTT